MKKKTLFATVGAGLSLALAGAAIAGVVSNRQAKEVGATISWTKVTSITSGGKYLITASVTASGSTTEYYLSSAAPASGKGASGKLADLSTASASNLYTFTASGTGYTITGDAGELYSTKSGAGLYAAADSTNTNYGRVWTVSYASGFFTAKDGTQNTYLELYNATDWRTYTSATQAVSSLTLYQATTVADVAATGITLGDGIATSMTVGGTQTVTATLAPAGTTESVNWSITDVSGSSVASVELQSYSAAVSTAVVTALNDGTFKIVATASKTTSVTIASAVITVSGASTSIAPATYTASGLSLTNSYATSNGDKTIDGAVICVENAMELSTDYSKSSSIVTYEKGAIQVKTAAGYIYNKTKFPAKVKDVLVSGVASTTNILIAGGASAKATTTAATSTSSGLIFTYSFAAPVDYFTVYATVGTGYMNSFTVEFVGGAETTASLAAYISGLIPDRADSTALCTGSTGNYVVAKTRFLAASAAVQSDFQSSSDAAVTAARTRYVHWCAVAGDNSPYSSTIVPQAASMVDGMTDGATIAILCAMFGLGVIALAGVMILRKKHN